MKPISGALAVAAILLTSVPSASAFDCRVPAVISTTKRTVCASATLTRLDQREGTIRRSVSATLPVAARGRLAADRVAFVQTRQTCGADPRCLDATYTAQLRLYSRLRQCAVEPNPAACTSRVIDAHRQELHRSM